MSDERLFVFRAGPLSNFARAGLRLKGPDDVERTYPTVEHYFQASKTLDAGRRDEIVAAPSPRAAKRAGQRIPLREDWEGVKETVMLLALRAKFQEEPFRGVLLRIGCREIIEESRHDLEWGARRCPDGWEGENRLGHLLMRVRTELQASEAVAAGR